MQLPIRDRVPERTTPLSVRRSARAVSALVLSLVLLPTLLVFTGCGASSVAANGHSNALVVSPGNLKIDTNCTGCNAVDAHGSPVVQFTATLPDGEPAPVVWSVRGGDGSADPGRIDATGRYTPPAYVVAGQAQVEITASLLNEPTVQSKTPLILSAGFLQPLTPENIALGPNVTVTFSGKLAEAGGAGAIHFALSDSETGSPGGAGSLGGVSCQRGNQAFTTCSVSYTSPASIPSNGVTYLVASAGSSKTVARILLNTSGVTSNPATHQASATTPIPLGVSGGNNHDFDAQGNTVADCCSGTLGALVKDNSGRQYVLSNNHVLARSDHASVGDAIIQPGLIDNNCTPNGEGPGTLPVASLTNWLPLKAAETNADVAIAQIGSNSLDPAGSILEIGTRQGDGSLASAPPGISSSGGKGEAATLGLRVAKSGRTTGLTCAHVSAIDLDVEVEYFRDCAETKPYLTKQFRNQIAVSGDRFTDAGDSGAMVLDVTNAEPVGLFFAGGTDAFGVVHAIANPVTDVLNELGTATSNGTTYTVVGGADHGVSCLSFGDSTLNAAQHASLSNAEIARGQQALFSARLLVDPGKGILGVAMGKSSDHVGEAAVIVYVNDRLNPTVPATVDGVRTLVIPTTMQAVAFGTAPLASSGSDVPTLPAAELNRGLEAKQKAAAVLQEKNGIFGMGVGQSLDDPHEAAIVVYVDPHHRPANLPAYLDGVRIRYIEMDRLHVTRSFSAAGRFPSHCPQRVGLESTAPLEPSFLSREIPGLQ